MREHLRLTNKQVAEVKAAITPDIQTGSEEFTTKVLTGRHADTNLLTEPEYRLIEKFIVRVQ